MRIIRFLLFLRSNKVYFNYSLLFFPPLYGLEYCVKINTSFFYSIPALIMSKRLTFQNK